MPSKCVSKKKAVLIWPCISTDPGAANQRSKCPVHARNKASGAATIARSTVRRNGLVERSGWAMTIVTVPLSELVISRCEVGGWRVAILSVCRQLANDPHDCKVVSGEKCLVPDQSSEVGFGSPSPDAAHSPSTAGSESQNRLRWRRGLPTFEVSDCGQLGPPSRPVPPTRPSSTPPAAMNFGGIPPSWATCATVPAIAGRSVGGRKRVYGINLPEPDLESTSFGVHLLAYAVKM
jgi:hypothetical protein